MKEKSGKVEREENKVKLSGYCQQGRAEPNAARLPSQCVSLKTLPWPEKAADHQVAAFLKKNIRVVDMWHVRDLKRNPISGKSPTRHNNKIGAAVRGLTRSSVSSAKFYNEFPNAGHTFNQTPTWVILLEKYNQQQGGVMELTSYCHLTLTTFL